MAHAGAEAAEAMRLWRETVSMYREGGDEWSLPQLENQMGSFALRTARRQARVNPVAKP